MEVLSDLLGELTTILTIFGMIMPYLVGYVVLILVFYVLWTFISRLLRPKQDFSALKTVTFGDESVVRSNFIASVLSVVLIFVLWAAFTGSALLPKFLHVPPAFTGQGSFEYTLQTDDGRSDTATVQVEVFVEGTEVTKPDIAGNNDVAQDDWLAVQRYRSKLIKVQNNDNVANKDTAQVVAVNGAPIAPGMVVNVGFAKVSMTGKGTLSVMPDGGWQMEPIWLPSPEMVWQRFSDISAVGYRNSSLGEHLGYSLFRVLIGFLLGAIVGIPLGYAMGLSDWFRGWFDPIVEFMRPVPPLALIPLVIIWAGIGEVGKIILLFLAALWIMAIGARSGVSGVRISKVHAAYSLGASKVQIMRHVIIPNSLPEIFTAARVAMGVCWGTVVAAELVAAEQGAGMMIMAASKFQLTDIVIMGIILIGIIGFGIDMLMRMLERVLVPWKGKG